MLPSDEGKIAISALIDGPTNDEPPPMSDGVWAMAAEAAIADKTRATALQILRLLDFMKIFLEGKMN